MNIDCIPCKKLEKTKLIHDRSNKIDWENRYLISKKTNNETDITSSCSHDFLSSCDELLRPEAKGRMPCPQAGSFSNVD